MGDQDEIKKSSFLTDEEFQLFRDKIYKESGIHFSALNRPILETRLKERLKQLNLTTVTNYWTEVNQDKEELNFLLDAVTTNLTKFFRNDAHFYALNHSVLPELILRKTKENDKKLKIWSAGCSTGEEPYSVGITCHDVIPDNNNWKVDILASDLSLKSLMTAKAGIYSKERLENVSPKFVEKYFLPSNNDFKVGDDIKQMIRFDYHNLKYDNGERNFDIIFCRNVIIYFDRKAQEEVINRLFTCLDEKGYLFIGHSESLFGMNTGFKFHKIDDACIYRKI